MRSRFTRLLMAAGGLLALVGTFAPQPAQAFTDSSIEFVAGATVHGGIGYPVTTLPTPTGPPEMNCLPLKTGPPNCHPVYDHERAVSVTSLVCANEVFNIGKPNKAPFHAGGCGFGGSGTVTGHCGLSGGQVIVIFTDALGQLFIVDIHFTGVAATLLLDGHWFKVGSDQHGLIVGDAVAIPPTPVTTPDQSCVDKDAEIFTVVGAAVAVTDPNL